MWSKTKDAFHNLRRHKIMVLIIIILSLVCFRLFTQNYLIQSPIISKHQPSYNDLLGELAGCNSAAAIAQNDERMKAENPDLFTNQ